MSVLELAQQIRQGDTMTLSAGASPRAANPQWTRLACAAAVSTSPSRLVRSLMSHNEMDPFRARTVPQMLIYPALVFFASLALFGGFANLIAPGFHDIFASFDTELPRLTNLILGTAAVVQSFGALWFVSLAFIAAVVTWRLVFQKTTVQNRGSQVRTLAESLADLIEANVAPSTAVRLAAQTAGDESIYQAAEHLATCMQQQRDPNREPYFGLPRSLAHAMSDTERPAATASLLRELAVVYFKSDRCSQNLMIALLEPFAIIFVALFAGFVLFSLLLPLTSLISNLSG
jgi:type IV pilus assembly protein PilC